MTVDSDLKTRKAALRKQILSDLEKITATDIAAASSRICARLGQQSIWQRAKSVLFFAPMPGEPDIWPVVLEAIQMGKDVALPRFDSEKGTYQVRKVQDAAKDVVSGHYGIREPHSYCPWVPLKGLDLVLVPGIGYDVHGHRLGRGKGYYDRLLADATGFKCGVAFDVQIVAEIPTGPHDIRLNCILTPTRWIET